MNTETRRFIAKEVYGVPEITGSFQSKIHELFYTQTRALTLKTAGAR